jgi:serine/threonine-protein kinase
MAPEQAAGRRAVGPAADIYGLGAILYECLTGAPPFRGPTPLDTLVLVLEGEPVPPRQQNPALPRDLELVCLKCLEKDPAARYPSAAALADDLERFLHGEGVEVRPRGPVDRVVRWARREPALASRLGGLAVFAAIAQANYLAGATVTAGQNLLIQGLLLFWAAGSWLCAAGAHRPRWAARVPFVWTGIDLTALTAILAIRHSGASPLLIGYPAIVVAAGLWFRVPLVWFATAAAGLAYAVLVALTVPAEVLRHDPHHPALFVAILGVIGFLCAYQVQRVRVLSRYYESRPGVSS